MSINNTPTIEPRQVTGIFTDYIAKTLPLAFDDSMSYYECLCALLKYINDTIVPDINNVNDGLGELQTFYEQLQSYVNNYFDNLDVQEEINQKLDKMVEDGTLTNLIKGYVDPYITAQNEEISNFKIEVNSDLTSIHNQVSSLASGSPAGVYSTTAALIEANPKTGVYIVTADGHIYSWTKDGDSAIDLGVYQATGNSDDLNYIINITDFGNITSGKYINYSTGNFGTLETTRASDYIPITPSAIIDCSNLGMTHNVDSRGLAYYDKNKTYISGYQYTINSRDFTDTAPNNAYFIRLTLALNSTPTLNVVNKFENIIKDINQLNVVEYDVTEYAKRNLTPSSYIKAETGTINALSGSYSSQFIPVLPSTSIILKGTGEYGDVRGLSYFDENFTFISGQRYNSNPNNELHLTIPATAHYMVFTIQGSRLSDLQLKYNLNYQQINQMEILLQKEYYFNKTLYKGREIQAFNKIICIGDSITSGTFNHNEGGSTEYVAIPQYSYPTKMSEILGIETTNKGKGGYTSTEIYNYFQNDDWSGHDCAIICVGQNDQTTTATDTAVQSMITKLKAENNNIKIFVTSVIKSYYLRNENRYNTITTKIKNTVANNTDCYYIPLNSLSFCVDNSPYLQGHLTALGYLQQANELINYISSVIHDNMNDFKYIQFIGTDYSYNE